MGSRGGIWGEEGHEKYQEPWSIPRAGGQGVWEKRQVHLSGQEAQQEEENEEQNKSEGSTLRDGVPPGALGN